MLQETTKIYELTQSEYIFFQEDIVTSEFKKGYVLMHSKRDMSGTYILTFEYKGNVKMYYDLFVKWNNEKEEKPYKRQLTFDELTNEMKILLEKRKLHFVNPKYYKLYPEYVRVD